MPLPYPRRTRRLNPATSGAMDFLQGHHNMASLLPTVNRLVALQKDCMARMPTMFSLCQVLHLEAGQLVLGVPTAALASKLKQQLPKLQDDLLKLGWQVTAIRIKVQVLPPKIAVVLPEKLHMPEQALVAFTALGEALPDGAQHAALKAAVLALTRHHGRSHE